MKCIGYDFSALASEHPEHAATLEAICAGSNPPLLFGVMTAEALFQSNPDTGGVLEAGETYEESDQRRAVRSLEWMFTHEARDFGVTPELERLIRQVPTTYFEAGRGALNSGIVRFHNSGPS